MKTYAIYYQKADGAGEENVVILHVPIHYPGVYKQSDDDNPKKRLAVLKRALQRIRQEIVIADTRIENDAIKASGQLDLETEANK